MSNFNTLKTCTFSACRVILASQFLCFGKALRSQQHQKEINKIESSFFSQQFKFLSDLQACVNVMLKQKTLVISIKRWTHCFYFYGQILHTGEEDVGREVVGESTLT